MFDVGFWEISLIGVIALLVIGPERLPGAARTVGLYVGRIRRYVSHVQADIQRELRADELRKMIEDPDASGGAGLREVVEETREAIGAVKESFEEAERGVQSHTMNWVAPDPSASETDTGDGALGSADPPDRVPEQTAERVVPEAGGEGVGESGVHCAQRAESEAPVEAVVVQPESESLAPEEAPDGERSPSEKVSSRPEVL